MQPQQRYLLSILSSLLLVHPSQCIKKVEVNSDTGVLMMDRSTEVRCDYIKWKQEMFYSLTWSIGYSGVKTDFLRYTSDGQTVAPSTTFVVPDLNSATEKKIDLRVLHGSDPEEEVEICCEVKVLRDSGYGNMQPLKKERCSDFKIVTAPIRPLEVNLFSSHRSAEVGDSIDLVCESRTDYSPKPTYVLLVNDEEVHNGIMETDNKLKASVKLTEDHFNLVRRSYGYGFRNRNSLVPGTVKVDCLGKFGNSVAANASETIQRSSHRSPKVWNEFNEDISRHGFESSSSNFKRRGFGTVPNKNKVRGAASYSYILLETTHRHGSIILGQISEDVMEDIPSLTDTREKHLECSENAVTVLNILGYHGYTVAGVGNTMDNRMVWTLSRKYEL